MIMTDGEITDFDDTVNSIVEGSDLPLSIIIVGIGHANFSSMDKLDGDKVPLYSQKLKRHASRDIVQFVEYKNYKDDPSALAKATLAELPG